MEKDFDISDRAGGVRKAIVTKYTVDVTTSLEIRFYWAGNGTTNIPTRGVYGPLISSISVDPSKLLTSCMFWIACIFVCCFYCLFVLLKLLCLSLFILIV